MNGAVAELLEELEAQARRHSRRLEAEGRLPAGFTHTHYPETLHQERENARQRACWFLATDLPTLRALLAGKAVPRSKLNPDYLHLLERWPS